MCFVDQPRLLDQAHHDGSSLYVTNPYPALGEKVTVFARVPHSSGVTAVHVRSIVDGEPAHTPAIVDRSNGTTSWWRATIEAHNPVVRYRFLLDRGERGYLWLNGAGVHRHDVTDTCDFRLTTFGAPPAWARDAMVYQIFPDRFARAGESATPPGWAIAADWDAPVIEDLATRSRQFYGGDLAGIRQKLDYIADLGMNTIYLTPFFPAKSSHRYDATTFDYVDPLLGGDAALAELSHAIHQRGMRLMGDLTTNHTGDGHEWHQQARHNRESAEADFYYWREHPDDYVSWLGVASLPKLNYGSAELARRMFAGPESVVAKWLRPPYCLDGWRIDVANMTGRYRDDDYAAAVARSVRATMAQVNPEAFLVAEHTHDATNDLPGDGWQATMNCAGFTRPVWAWLTRQPALHHFLGVPAAVPSWSGEDVMATMRAVSASVPWSIASHNLNLIGSHDTARIRTVVGDPARVEVAAALLFTSVGVPMTYAGDEIGLEGDNGENGRRPFPWQHPEKFDATTLDAYRRLAALRTATPALRRGGLRWVHASGDSLAYLRETSTERVLVHLARASGNDVKLDAGSLELPGDAENLYGGEKLAVSAADDSVTLPGDGPSVQIWRLPQP
ncbi:MAG: alpha-amylase family glycosyl hydrolase [Acidothermaceae bacterium]